MNGKGELILEIDVKITDILEVKGSRADIALVSFTGRAHGRYFTGETAGVGVDAQKITKDGKCLLSARYILEGTDLNGEKCRIFIENNTNAEGGLTPALITDSKALSDWESASLSAEIASDERGLTVRIYSDIKKISD